MAQGFGSLRKGSRLEYLIATTRTDKYGKEKTTESWQTIILKEDPPKKIKDKMWINCCYETGLSGSRLFKMGSDSFNFEKHDPDGGWRFIDEAENKLYNKRLKVPLPEDSSVKPKQSKASAKVEPLKTDSVALNKSLSTSKTTPPTNAASVTVSSSSSNQKRLSNPQSKREREPSREPSQEPAAKQLKPEWRTAIMMYGDKTDPEEIGRDILLQLEELRKQHKKMTK